MRSTFIVMEPTLHCDHQTKNLPCYHEQALCAGLWETVRLWRAHVCGREWVCGHEWVCAGLRLSSGVLLHHFPRDPIDRQGLSVNEAAVLVQFRWLVCPGDQSHVSTFQGLGYRAFNISMGPENPPLGSHAATLLPESSPQPGTVLSFSKAA